MNNRWLYRAKKKADGQWIEGTLTIMQDECFIIDPIDNKRCYAVDESTICQCTGLKDKNGDLIFENDIIRSRCLYRVVWRDTYASWCLEKKGSKLPRYFGETLEPGDVSVAGNRFDNPDKWGY